MVICWSKFREEMFCVVEKSPQRIWDKIEEKMLVQFADSGCPIFRVTTPLSRCKLKSKGHGKLSIHFAADQETIETIFRKIVSANQLNLYGAVAKMCEECESLHDRSEQPEMVMGQSSVLNEIKTEVPLENDDPAWETLHCNKMKIELRGFHNKIDWVNVVWMQDSWVLLKLDSISWRKTLENNFMQWPVVSTLFQEMMDHHNQKDGSMETQTLDPCWKSRLVACMVNIVEIRILVSEWRQHALLGDNFSWIK